MELSTKRAVTHLMLSGQVRVWRASGIEVVRVGDAYLQFVSWGNVENLQTPASLLGSEPYGPVFISSNKMTAERRILTISEALEIGKDNIIKVHDEFTGNHFYIFFWKWFLEHHETMLGGAYAVR